MPNFNSITIVGHLTRDPELRVVGSTTVCSTGIAVSRKWRSNDGETNEKTCFVDIKAWEKTGEFMAQYLNKGSAVLINGELELEQWETDAGKRSKHVINVKTVQGLSRSEDGGSKPKRSEPKPSKSSNSGYCEELDEPPF